MEITKQTQTAGDYSTQMQAGVINNNYTIVNGIDEARARSIWQEEYAIACQEWTQEAQRIAMERVQQLEEKVIPKMLNYDKSLSFFADPAFQFLIRKAQMVAASTERVADYDMLADLILHRVEQTEDRHRRLGISKAIEIIDQISDEALVGISMFYALSKFLPTSDDIHEGLSVLNDLYRKILCEYDLPTGDNWLEHLDVLNAIRLGVKGIGSFKKMKDYMPTMLRKYLVAGAGNDSEEYAQLKEEFNACNLPLSTFVSHPLKSGYIKLKVSSNIEEIYITEQIGEDTIKKLLNEEQKKVMLHAIDLLHKDESQDPQMKTKFMEAWNEFPTLKKVGEWWDHMPCHFAITPIGVALANAYIHGKDATVPCMY